MMMGGADVGSSVLFAFLAKAALGGAVLEGHRLVLHPVAFAGWLGLLVTALNLIPVGQLDGGHLVHAMLGHRAARVVGVVALGTLVVLGLFVWSGLLVWALLIVLVAGTTDVPPLNDVSRVGQGRMALGAVALALLLLILLPVPRALYEAFGIHSPYL
jgi:membrane-associated protease RseP (regulator of RpoE activity)